MNFFYPVLFMCLVLSTEAFGMARSKVCYGNAQALQIQEDVSTAGQLTANCGAGTSFNLWSQPKLGGVFLDSASGAFTYIPHPDAIGNDSFAFSVSNGTATSLPVIVSVAIVPDQIDHVVNVDLPMSLNSELEFEIPKYTGDPTRISEVRVEVDLSTRTEVSYYGVPFSSREDVWVTLNGAGYISNGTEVDRIGTSSSFNHVTQLQSSRTFHTVDSLLGEGTNRVGIGSSYMGRYIGLPLDPQTLQGGISGKITIRYVEAPAGVIVLRIPTVSEGSAQSERGYSSVFTAISGNSICGTSNSQTDLDFSRGLMEFSVGDLSGYEILDAKLIMTGSSVSGSPQQSRFLLYGYSGNGQIEATDAYQTSAQIGPSWDMFSLNPIFVHDVKQHLTTIQSNYAGFVLKGMDGAGCIRTSDEMQSYFSPLYSPTLILHLRQ